MQKLIILFLIFIFNLNAQDFKIATYNVENLFDLIKQNSEYKEYVPNTNANWNLTTYNHKLNNVIKVIKELDADIIALQEIENKNVLIELFKRLPQYKYYSFAKYPRSAVGVGFLSKIKIIENRQIDVKFQNKLFRPILETTFELENIEFKVFNNHWPSKAVAESYRIKYAKTLQDRLNELPKDYDYILVGDFNSNYDEMNSFRNNSKLNNSKGITGINHILNTIYTNDTFVTYDDVLKIDKKVNYNLWLELPIKDRFSNKFKKQNNTPDNIIISPALFDTKKLSYIPNSFDVFKPNYLYKNNSVNRWQFSSNKHLGSGYSDHLPIIASFSTNKGERNALKELIKEEKKEINYTIEDLYKKEKLTEPIIIKNITVIYKNDDMAIIKDQSKAIYIYKNAKNLKLEYNYDLQVNQIETYNGLKEIKDFYISKENKKIKSYKYNFLDANEIDILDIKYQNEIVTNLKGIVKNKKLYFNENKFIKLFATNKNNLPKDGDKIKFITGHLSTYKGNIQILIHSKDDYKVEN